MHARQNFSPRGGLQMANEKAPEDVAHWTAPPYIDPKLGDKPPVGAWIDKDAVCRDCMKAAEEVAMRRGFVDPISPDDAGENTYICTRCGKGIAPGS
jgi:hypothetical protein